MVSRKKIISMKERDCGLPLVIACLPVAALMLLFSLHFGMFFMPVCSVLVVEAEYLEHSSQNGDEDGITKEVYSKI